ncbi:Indigoidine synthase A like protein [Tissierella praeacuta DSM 18095]|uniref:Indigoidine synthase A like protein n=1 Tax=Tissierella praeacuta DSM 18095 TaxID=1123404 RepID=A0A1M4VHN4_9FIRM|nr:pseudouridine-5'-phosphate glycosidase [Tissierella praeacuta]SHE68531.1 Indigoidine synthase A like protein [Tissierella praeacuta DSM 18095]SUO99133.1 Pseudouridine-5'-phosphate glycosidase [Tissierella praeacuta]
MNIETKFLVETALLTHGLKSIDNETLVELWPWEHRCIAWVDRGEIIIGNIKEFIGFRNRAEELIRIDKDIFMESCNNGISGALTASGTMMAAREKGIHIAVTAGMGGIGDIVGEELCADLPAIATMDITLIATSPKDVIDIEGTIKWLLEHNVSIWGKDTDTIDGFMLTGKPIKITGKYDGQPLKGRTLLLNPIPHEMRLKDLTIIEKAKNAGKEAEERGQYYHPAANAMIDRLSFGKSSEMQLNSLIENSIWANELTR